MPIEIRKNQDSRGGYILHAECIVPRAIEEVFPFFADARNLEQLTPTWLKFQIITPEPIDLRKGQIIDYRLRVHGLPLRWQSEITAWEPMSRFIDEARRSPYKFWNHEHLFESCEQGTRVIDIVHYGVPGGAIVHWLSVRRDIEKIFAYRQKVLAEVFPQR